MQRGVNGSRVLGPREFACVIEIWIAVPFSQNPRLWDGLSRAQVPLPPSAWHLC